jgi:hypothetical protein
MIESLNNVIEGEKMVRGKIGNRLVGGVMKS